MKPNPKTQSDTTLKFDGAERESTGRVNSKMHTNQWSGHANDGREVNFGRGPTVAGRTGHKTPGSTGTVPALPPQGSVRDSINRGAQVRTPGGTRSWMPSATQNYHGNPDKIRIGQNGGGTYNSEKPSKTPATRRGDNNFNFGPKSQY